MKRIIDIPQGMIDAFSHEEQWTSVLCRDMNTVLQRSTSYEERPQDDWIPVKYRPLTEKEKEEYPDSDFMYGCQLPDDGEEVIVTTSSGYVVEDTFCRSGRDEGCYFECYCDEGDVIAWKPKPKPYEAK